MRHRERLFSLLSRISDVHPLNIELEFQRNVFEEYDIKRDPHQFKLHSKLSGYKELKACLYKISENSYAIS